MRPWLEPIHKIQSTLVLPWPWWKIRVGICPITTWPTILNGVGSWDVILHWGVVWNGWKLGKRKVKVFTHFATKSKEILLRRSVPMIAPLSRCAILCNMTICYRQSFRWEAVKIPRQFGGVYKLRWQDFAHNWPPTYLLGEICKPLTFPVLPTYSIIRNKRRPYIY